MHNRVCALSTHANSTHNFHIRFIFNFFLLLVLTACYISESFCLQILTWLIRSKPHGSQWTVKWQASCIMKASNDDGICIKFQARWIPKKIGKGDVMFNVRVRLVAFYCISTLVGYLMSNPVYIYISIYISKK